MPMCLGSVGRAEGGRDKGYRLYGLQRVRLDVADRICRLKAQSLMQKIVWIKLGTNSVLEV